ncbi:MAG: glycosyltransferase family 39 protein [Anaerolineaceae bacterium]|nr:glycosyltransferase family 39 protein [Anaerolineaceae bacterium]
MKKAPKNIRIRSKKWLLLAAIILLAAVIRFYDLTDPPLDFHPARQFHSAIIARGIYTRLGGVYPGWQAGLNIAQESSEIRIEPPILEYLVAITYRIFATDQLWIARIFSIIFWLAGGIGLFSLVKKMSNTAGAFIAVLFFLFLPYGVIASRSFQPDPLMVTMSIFAYWGIWRWHQKPDNKTAILAGILSAAAILVKQVAVFYLLGGFAGLVIASMGLKKALRERQVWLIGILSLAPTLVYNLYGIFIQGTLAGQYSQRFFLDLLMDPRFYIRWTMKIRDTVGISVFLLFLFGVLLYKTKAKRGLMIGMLGGYLIYGFVFAYHISTHDYYQLPLIPIVAIGLAPVADLIFQRIQEIEHNRWVSFAAVGILILAVGLSFWEARTILKKEDFHEVPIEWKRVSDEMGGPQTPTAGLMSDYGASLDYYAYILPAYWWPEEEGILVREIMGDDLESLFERRTYAKQYFIITDFDEFNDQPGLKALLYDQFPIFKQKEYYLIFDLKGK